MAWPRCSKHKHGEYVPRRGRECDPRLHRHGRRARVNKVYPDRNSSLSQQQRRAGVEQQLLYARRAARMDGSIFQMRKVSPINSLLFTVIE